MFSRRTRFAAGTIGAVALVLVTAACSSSSPESGSSGSASGTVTIGLSLDHLDAARLAEVDAVQAAADKAGAKVVQQTSKDDASVQAGQIQTLIDASHVKALIVVPVNFDQISASLSYAKSQGVPVVIMDKGVTDTTNIAFQVTSAGVIEGQRAAGYLTGLGTKLATIELLGALTDQNATGRRDGFDQSITGSSVSVLQEIATEWNTQTALDGLTNALQSHPDVDAIYSPSDYLLPPIESALTAIGRWVPVGQDGHVTLISIDGDAVACKAMAGGYLDADIVADVTTIGSKAVDAAVGAAGGQTFDPVSASVPGVLVTLDQYRQNPNLLWGCAASASPSPTAG